jgi:hemerythrin
MKEDLMEDLKDEYIAWSPTFSMGVTLIDKQHKEIVKLTNELYNHCIGDTESERKYFRKVIKKAVEYVRQHFATEENIMIKTGYPGYVEHKKEHDAFIINILGMIKAYRSDNKMTLIEFTHFLKDWVLAHIAVCDKEYFKYFMQIATRKKDGTLSINVADIQKVKRLYDCRKDIA